MITGLMSFLQSNLRVSALITAFALYALASSPTPDRPGWIELCIGLGLITSCAVPAWHLIRTSLQARTLWQAAGAGLLLYGLTIAIVLTLINGHPIHNAMRDIVPFLYLFLPLFLTDLFYDRPKRTRSLIILSCLMGTVFAVRSLLEGINFLGLNMPDAQELYYLANSPLVLFASCLGFYGLYSHATDKITIRAGIFALGFALITLVTLAAMALTLQRASLGVFTFYSIVIAAIFMMKSPLKAISLTVIIAIALIPVAGDVINLVEALMHKTQAHGLNNRELEWAAVWHETSTGWLHLLFGGGWGTTFESPAVAGVRVNFTHSLLSAMLLKTGMAGLTLTLLYLAGLAQMLWSLVKHDIIMGFAIAGPFLIDVLLYGSYKSLDFGILLLLIPVTLLSRYATKT